MTQITHRIAPRYVQRYHPFPMKRVLGLFVYHTDRTCPLCGSPHVHRTKRGRILEFWLLLFLPIRPYRCGKCRLRFYGPKQLAKITDLTNPDEAE
jgi:hypothetical protein